METLTITRVLSGQRRGSSRPIVVDTDRGRHLVKLRGAAQGAGALIAEIVVGHLGEALDLPVLPRRLALLQSTTPTDDRDDELADLLGASVGINLAFPMLDDARDARSDDLALLTSLQQAAVLWLDRFVLNPDRTERNPNVLYHDGRLYLIDHASALRFQYDWLRVTEETPRQIGTSAAPHIFESAAGHAEWPMRDAAFASCLTRTVLEDAVASVPAPFLAQALGERAVNDDAMRRRRAAYGAFLWKRLKPPRAFALAAPVFVERASGSPPRWLSHARAARATAAR